jgi:hypothetical protein
LARSVLSFATVFVAALVFVLIVLFVFTRVFVPTVFVLVFGVLATLARLVRVGTVRFPTLFVCAPAGSGTLPRRRSCPLVVCSAAAAR